MSAPRAESIKPAGLPGHRIRAGPLHVFSLLRDGSAVTQEGRGEVVASHPIRPSDSYMPMSGFGIKSPLRSLPRLLRLVGEEVVVGIVRILIISPPLHLHRLSSQALAAEACVRN